VDVAHAREQLVAGHTGHPLVGEHHGHGVAGRAERFELAQGLRR
jgi:hypothetical protein